MDIKLGAVHQCIYHLHLSFKYEFHVKVLIAYTISMETNDTKNKILRFSEP